MNEYHKIPTVFKRNPDTKFKTLLMWEFATPELKYLADNPWEFTEKVDGTNIRIMRKEDRTIEFGGKTDRAQLPAPLVAHLNETFLPLADTFAELFEDTPVCLYGEGHGAGIQKGGGNYSPTQVFVLFDVKVGNWWLKREDVASIGSKLGIPVVPVIGQGTLGDLVTRVRGGFNSQWGEFPAEGIVARPTVELRARGGYRIITKLKNRDFPT